MGLTIQDITRLIDQLRNAVANDSITPDLHADIEQGLLDQISALQEKSQIEIECSSILYIDIEHNKNKYVRAWTKELDESMGEVAISYKDADGNPSKNSCRVFFNPAFTGLLIIE